MKKVFLKKHSCRLKQGDRRGFTQRDEGIQVSAALLLSFALQVSVCDLCSCYHSNKLMTQQSGLDQHRRCEWTGLVFIVTSRSSIVRSQQDSLHLPSGQHDADKWNKVTKHSTSSAMFSFFTNFRAKLSLVSTSSPSVALTDSQKNKNPVIICFYQSPYLNDNNHLITLIFLYFK